MIQTETTIKKFAKYLAREFRKEGFDNPKNYKEILRQLRKEMPEVKGTIKRKKLPEFLTIEEARTFINTAHILQTGESANKGLLAECYIKTGLRNSELCNLRIENIDFVTGIFKVVNGKGGKDRFGIIPPSLIRQLNQLRKNRTSGFLFLNNRGNPYSTRSIQYIIKEIIVRSGIVKEIHPHSLRHTFATILKESGVELRDIQKLLGHTDIRTTTIYEHMSVLDQKEKVLEITDKL